MSLEMQRGHLSKAEPGLLFRGSVCVLLSSQQGGSRTPASSEYTAGVPKPAGALHPDRLGNQCKS